MDDGFDFNDLGVITAGAAVEDLKTPAPLLLDGDQPPAQQAEAPAIEIPRTQITLEGVLQRYTLIAEGGIWDRYTHKILKKIAFKDTLGAPLFNEWLNHPERKVASKADFLRLPPPQGKGERGLEAALVRYIYLRPSDMAWDTVDRELIPLKDLRYSIADCFDDWLKHPQRKDVPRKNLVFDPTNKQQPSTHINTFRDFGLTPAETSKGCSAIQFLLEDLCNRDEDIFMWLRRWLALPLQQPGAKMASAVLMHSDVHGSGKSLFFDVIMRKIYGEYGKTVGQQQLESQYNEWMAQTLYCCYEEVLTRGQKYSHTGTLKQIITGASIRIEKKFTSGWEESNHMNCVFLSNEVLPLPVEPSDRRYLVVWPEKKLNPELQAHVMREIDEEGISAFYRYLLDTDMTLPDGSVFNTHTQPPMTRAKEKLIEHGLPSWQVFLNAWRRGEIQINNIVVPFCSVRVSDLFKIFDRWCLQNKEHGLGAHKFISFISTQLRKRAQAHYSCANGGPHGKSAFFMIGEPPEGITQLQWLANCVSEFERIFSQFSN